MLTDQDFQTFEKARFRSNVCGFLATALRYPDQESLSSLRDADRWRGWLEALRPVNPVLFRLLEAARAYLTEAGADGSALTSALQDRHTQLFGHAVRGACPPYELEYERGDIPQQAAELADIAGFYNAFGLVPHTQAHERADHAAVQCEFLSVLAAKEVYAAETGNTEACQVLHDAQQAFLADHAGRWLPALATRLIEADPVGFYGTLGELLREFIIDECRHFHADCGPQFLELRPIDAQRDATIECGVEESCPGASSTTLEDKETFVQLGIDRT